MDNKKITVVINTFNSEDKIYNCIDSISSELKVIVVENNCFKVNYLFSFVQTYLGIEEEIR